MKLDALRRRLRRPRRPKLVMAGNIDLLRDRVVNTFTGEVCDCRIKDGEALRDIADREKPEQRGLVVVTEWPQRFGPHHQGKCMMHKKCFECTCIKALEVAPAKEHDPMCFKSRATRWMGMT